MGGGVEAEHARPRPVCPPDRSAQATLPPSYYRTQKGGRQLSSATGGGEGGAEHLNVGAERVEQNALYYSIR